MTVSKFFLKMTANIPTPFVLLHEYYFDSLHFSTICIIIPQIYTIDKKMNYNNQYRIQQNQFIFALTFLRNRELIQTKVFKIREEKRSNLIRICKKQKTNHFETIDSILRIIIRLVISRMISLASDYQENGGADDVSQRVETDQENENEKFELQSGQDANIKFNFDNFQHNPDHLEQSDDHPNNEQSHIDNNMYGHKVQHRQIQQPKSQLDSKMLYDKLEKDVINKFDQMIVAHNEDEEGNSSSGKTGGYMNFQNVNLPTDEDAEHKRAILQLIFVDDIIALKNLLQIKGVDDVEMRILDDLGELNFINDQKQNNHNYSGLSKGKITESVRTLNWYEQHVKTDLDAKITPLAQAAYLGRKKIVQMMLKHYTYLDLNLATSPNMYTPLSAACMAGNFEIVCLLAQNGSDVNKLDSMQQSPLIYCFSRLNEDENYFENKALALKMADILLAHGADINQYSHGRTILMNFCRQKYTNMIRSQQMILLEVIQYLMMHGADAFNLKCLKTNKNSYELALENLKDTQSRLERQAKAKLQNQEKQEQPIIEQRIIDILTNVKQEFFHPKVNKKQNSKGGSKGAGPTSSSMSGNKGYRAAKSSCSVNGQPQLIIDGSSMEVGCCGCTSIPSINVFGSFCQK